VTGQALLGMDLGTSGAKAILLGTDGRLLAEAAPSYPVDTPHPGGRRRTRRHGGGGS
jgi:xylulokinase